jgi:outer membrane protein assembly factor BamB
MVGHDPQHTNRSASTGPLTPHLLFTFPGPCSTPLIGPDGSLYSWCPQGLTALTASGRRQWIAPLSPIEGGPPALSPGGLVLANANSGRTMYRHLFIVALAETTGQQRWKVDTLPWAPQLNNVPNSKGRAPLVTAANVLYVPFLGPGHANAGVEMFAPTGRPLQRLLPHVPPHCLIKNLLGAGVVAS